MDTVNQENSKIKIVPKTLNNDLVILMQINRKAEVSCSMFRLERIVGRIKCWNRGASVRVYLYEAFPGGYSDILESV